MLIHQLEKADIDDRLIIILQSFLNEKAKSSNPGDHENLTKLSRDVILTLNHHSGTTLRIALMQRFIMYGVNEPMLVSYYLDVFTKLSDSLPPKEKRRFVRYLIKKTQVTEYHCFNPDLPTLLEALHTQLRAWLHDIENKRYLFASLDRISPSPCLRFLYKAPIFMQMLRLMNEVAVIKPTKNLSEVYDYLSRAVVSSNLQKYSPKTLKNGYEFRDPEDLQTTIYLLGLMKERAEQRLDEILGIK